jgi:N-acetylmuramoyl-L-alanine amidase
MSKVLYPALSKDVAGQTVNLTDGGVGQFATGALLKSNMPGTLAETVFLTNNAEATRLLDESATGRRQQIAAALAQGIVTSLK